MLDTLIESRRAGRRDVQGTVLGMLSSTTLQAALLIGAVHATMHVSAGTRIETVDSIVLFAPERPSEPAAHEQHPAVTPLAPLPKGFKVLVAPSEFSTEILPADPDVIFDPRNYTGIGVEGGVFDGVDDVPGPDVDLARVFEHAVVDQLPERISCPLPQYPQMMQQAKIRGQVLLRFIVETDGRVGREHIETLSVSHRAFEGPATEMVAQCRFRPGRVRGRAVRVLVEMPVVFDLTAHR